MERTELLRHVVLELHQEECKIMHLFGRAGIGRSVFANQVARSLLSTGDWTEAYWMDFTGILAQTSIPFQVMFKMGIVYEAADIHFLSALLRRRHGSIGFVFTGLDGLLRGHDAEFRFLDFLQILIQGVENVQILFLSNRELKETKESIKQHKLDVFSKDTCSNWIRNRMGNDSVEKSDLESLLDGCRHPLCLDILSGVLRMGEVEVKEILQGHQSDIVLALVQQIHTESLSSLEEKEQRQCTIPF